MWLRIIGGEFVFVKQEILDGSINGLKLDTVLGEKFGEVKDFGGALDVVGFQLKRQLLELRDDIFIIVKEDDVSLVVECNLEKGLVGKIEDSKS